MRSTVRYLSFMVAPKEPLLVAFAKDMPPHAKLALHRANVAALEAALGRRQTDALNPHEVAAMRARARAITAELDSVREGALAGLWALTDEQSAELESIHARAEELAWTVGVPLDDEPVTPEEERSVEQGREDARSGRVVSDAELRQRLGT